MAQQLQDRGEIDRLGDARKLLLRKSLLRKPLGIQVRQHDLRKALHRVPVSIDL